MLRDRLAFMLLALTTLAPGNARAAPPQPTPAPPPPTAEGATRRFPVLLPDDHNLQYLPFWVARGAGFFHDEGLDLTLLSAPEKTDTERLFQKGRAQIAVLPPPMYMPLIAAKTPLVLVANLLANDPINVVVPRALLAERKLSPDMPLVERLKGLKGLKVGVAPGPPPRLRALYRSVGLKVEDYLQIVTLHGRDQNRAFAEHKVDVLYCHTPYLEKALTEQDGVILVNQSGGEVPALAMRQIHALVVTRALFEAEPGVVRGLQRAIGRALALIHRDPGAAVAALEREVPARGRRQLETIVGVYGPAVPTTPAVSADGFSQALLLFPAGSTPPKLDGIDLARYVDARSAQL